MKLSHWILFYKYRRLASWHSTLVKSPIPVCHGFSGPCFRIGKLRRQSTAYHEDCKNFAFLCDKCQEESYLYWQERWDEYYSSIM